MKRIVICLASLVFCLGTFIGCRQNPPELLAWNIYQGQIEDYRVTIEDTKEEGANHFVRRAELQPLVNNEVWKGPLDSNRHITGLDYNADGTWDRIFYCGYPERINGCNSVMLDGNGRMIAWDPCGLDEDGLAPFTPKEVKTAITALNEALDSIHQPEYRTSTIEGWRKKNGYPAN